MKFKEIINEQHFQFTVDGYGYNEGEDLPMDADDPIKKWHYMTTPEGERITLDHSPYQWMDKDKFAEYVAKHKASKPVKVIEQITKTNFSSAIDRFVVRHTSGAYISNFSFGSNSEITNAKIFLTADAAKIHIEKLSEGWQIIPVVVTIREIKQ